ncbi:MAG TPA: ATP-binding cassette domain-containing protein [Candidatus Eisenbacteria bacterium]|nr:ATP-binding cassette domain-containing protein [Candidatus Eisenbacteria bacterium]
MIEFRDVIYSIGDRRILTDVSFVVGAGETRVILGPSGSGKSTILRLLLGLVRPDSGAILIEGEDLTRVREDRLRQVRQMIGMVFQQGALFDSMTVGENVGFSLLEHEHIAEDEVEHQVRDILRQVGLAEDLVDRMPDELSGGMQRRVAIARALAARDPRILLYDEPTTGLDPQAAQRITDLILHLRDQYAKTSLMVTHDIADAYKVGNCITLLHEGRVVFDGEPSELDRAENPVVNEFLAPFRAAVRRVATRSAIVGDATGRTPFSPGGTP